MKPIVDARHSFPYMILFAGCLTVLLAIGLRASFGLYLKPMSMELGWGREVVALALAVQNLIWGAVQPFASAAAEKWGAGRVLGAGGALYAVGIAMMAHSTTANTLLLSAGLFVGVAQSATALGVVMGVVGRAVPPSRRTLGLGIVTAAGAAGQLSVIPLGQSLLDSYGWSLSLTAMAVLALVMVLCAPILRRRPTAKDETGNEGVGLGETLKAARTHRGFWLLTSGFFVCGFQISFLSVHLPPYISDLNFSAWLGVQALMIIGLFNIAGNWGAGVMGDRQSKKSLLTWLYLARSVVMALFVLVPVTETTVILFSAVMGLLWLSTVPLTAGLVAQIFGARFMSTLFGIVFFSHQIGSFLGVWLGGWLHDVTGSYESVWWMGVVLGLVAALLHWPIDDREHVWRPAPSVAQ